MWSWWHKMAEMKTLGTVATYINGRAFKPSEWEKEGKPIIRIQNLTNSNIPFNYSHAEFDDKYLVHNGDLLFAWSASLGAHIWKGEDAWLNQHIFRVMPNEGINRDYLYYYLLTVVAELYSKTHGSGMVHITKGPFLSTPIPVPSLSKQEMIVTWIEEMLSQLDAGVETLKNTKAQLAVYRQAVLTDAFEAKGEFSKVRLDEISDIIGGITKGRDFTGVETIELPYLRVANVQNGYLVLSEIKTIKLRPDEKEKYLLKYGDVLYTEGGDRDKLGRGTVWRDEIPDCVHQNHIFKARINPHKAIPEYVAYWSMSKPARNYFYQKGKQSVNLASINKTVLSALELPLPSLEGQKQIVDQIKSRLSVCDSIEQTVNTALQQAEALRQSILKQAFEGRL